MTVLVTEGAPTGGTTVSLTITATSPLTMGLVDGAETPCPFAKLVDVGSVAVGDRMTATLRSPQLPVLNPKET